MKTNEEIEKEFAQHLWKMPYHYFSEFNNGIRVMAPISYALYQSFCSSYNYEFGVFDLASEEIRKDMLWGQHEDDWKILLPIFIREKQKFSEFLKLKQLLKVGKPIFGMIHLSFDETDDGRIKRAIREVQVLEEEGVDGIIVENYHGSVDDIKDFFEAANFLLKNSKLIIGINILPNEFEEALELASKVGGHFIQLDYVAGTYNSSKFIYEPTFLEIREKYPHIIVMGGVWPKYYQPVPNSILKDDIKNGMRRADAIVVTGSGTGKETPLDKIKEFRKIASGFPLIIGAGLTVENLAEQMKHADGAIVGSCFKTAGTTRKEISRELVKKFMNEVKTLRGETTGDIL